jgi:hypothetical protein
MKTTTQTANRKAWTTIGLISSCLVAAHTKLTVTMSGTEYSSRVGPTAASNGQQDAVIARMANKLTIISPLRVARAACRAFSCLRVAE